MKCISHSRLNFAIGLKRYLNLILLFILIEAYKKRVRVPYSAHGIRQREQWAISKALEGKGNLFEAKTPIIAGTPLSRAN